MAKGIEKFIERIAVQTAIYWGNPEPDAYGTNTYDDPIDIKVRWEDKAEIIIDSRSGQTYGKEVMSRAKITPIQDLELEGFLKLGSTDDYDSSTDITNPKTVDEAYGIRKISKVPMIRKTDEFVRAVWI